MSDDASSSNTSPPAATAVSVKSESTCVVVLDLSLRCDDSGSVCGEIIASARRLLDRVRDLTIPVAFTISRSQRHTRLDGIATGLERRATEPVFYPNAVDKLSNGGLLEYVRSRGAQTLIVMGSSSNNCVMYTVTSAARTHALDVCVPIDAVNAKTEYQQGYALFQMTNLPAPPGTGRVSLTTTQDIEFY